MDRKRGKRKYYINVDHYEENTKGTDLDYNAGIDQQIIFIFRLFAPVEINQNRNAICHIINSIFNHCQSCIVNNDRHFQM